MDLLKGIQCRLEMLKGKVDQNHALEESDTESQLEE